jgi:hypothetical protein
MLHLVVEVLVELNKLKEKIQYDLVNISAIGCTLDASISILKDTFCGLGPNFDKLTKKLGPFLSKG